MTKIRELSLIVAIIVLLGVIVIQSITNNQILSLIGQQPRQLSLPFLSMIMKAGRQLQQQITGQNNDNIGNCQTGSIISTSFIQPLNHNTGAQNLSLTSIFKQVENSVVQVTSKVSNPSIRIIINGNPLESQSTRLGSGFVLDKQGHIITNYHVVGNAKTVDVTFVNGNSYNANVIGSDPFSDIAVIEITDDFSAENLVPLVIANSSSLEIVSQKIIIGNPFGLSDTMTTVYVTSTSLIHVGFQI